MELSFFDLAIDLRKLLNLLVRCLFLSIKDWLGRGACSCDLGVSFVGRLVTKR